MSDEIKTIHVNGKVSDMCGITWPDGSDHDGYVPSGIGIGGGDYLELEINAATGQILNWPGLEAVEAAAAEAAEEKAERARDHEEAQRNRRSRFGNEF